MTAEEGVYVTIGVSPNNAGMVPPRVTIQVRDVDPNKPPNPVAFEMDLLKMHPTLNQQLSRGLMQFTDKVKPRRLRLLTGKE